MRETQWPPARGRVGLLIDRPRLRRGRWTGLARPSISGDLDTAVAALAPGAPILGLHALAPEGAHALRIGRASALLVTPAPIVAPEGWRDGWCATSVDDGWAAVEVFGADAPHALLQGTSADLAARLALGRRRLLWPTRPSGADRRGLPPACRGAVARDAARRGSTAFEAASACRRAEPSGRRR